MKKTTLQTIHALRFPFVLIAVMWFVQLFRTLSHINFTFLGIYPREVAGLKGIVTAPLIHGDWQHLISNTVPFAALSAVIFLFYRRVAVKSFLLIYLFTGLAVWLMGRSVWHIGASGVVYGLLSFVFWNGVFRRSFKSIAISLAILVLYSGYFLGIVPGQEGISWESHLLGAFVGIGISYFFKDTLETDEERREAYYEDAEPSQYLLPRDTFEKTLAERERERGYWHRNTTY